MYKFLGVLFTVLIQGFFLLTIVNPQKANAADTVIINRMWETVVLGNPSLSVDVQNLKQNDGVLHVVIKTHFSIPQKLRGYVSPDDDSVLPLSHPVSYILTDTYINCDGSTYRVFWEKLFNLDDDMFFVFASTKKIPTTIDTNSAPELIMKKYCK